jgi:hypothetical protein
MGEWKASVSHLDKEGEQIVSFDGVEQGHVIRCCTFGLGNTNAMPADSDM